MARYSLFVCLAVVASLAAISAVTVNESCGDRQAKTNFNLNGVS